MIFDERVKLGGPLMGLIGCCLAADGMTPESNLKDYSKTLIRLANEIEKAWYEINRSESVTRLGGE